MCLKLTVNMMTRGRPEIVAQTVARTLPNIVLPNTTLMLLVDDDDPETIAALTPFAMDEHVLVSVRPREDTRGEKYDRALTECPADVYLPTCDYAPITTKGFDERILEATAKFPDGIGCVYTQMANMSFPHYQAPTAKLVELMGYIYPPWFPFWFIDHWLDDISRMIDRVAYLEIASPPIQLPGGHKTIGMRDLEFWTWLYDLGRNERRRQAGKIIEALDEPQWRKDMLRANFPWHEERSLRINISVRADRENIQRTRGGVESEPDARYLRIRDRADALMTEWSADYQAERDAYVAALKAQAA